MQTASKTSGPRVARLLWEHDGELLHVTTRNSATKVRSDPKQKCDKFLAFGTNPWMMGWFENTILSFLGSRFDDLI